MFEIAKNEFSKWLSDYQKHELSEYEITLLNIIIKNFDEVASKSTAGGARANYLIKKLETISFEPKKDVLQIQQKSFENTSIIKRLTKLEVKAFRGFSTNLTFDFSKQYTTFFGNNGSGKSSLCESLEYKILGNVEEASSRRIPLEQFLKNKLTNSFIPPVLFGIVDDNEKEVSANFEEYQFAFIEKNRIDRFSHISATTPSEKTERLASLFGLSEFTNFVKGFTDSLDSKITLETTKQQELTTAVEKNKENEERLSEKESDLKTNKDKLNQCLKQINNPDITDLDNALIYLQKEDGSGKIKDIENLCISESKEIFDENLFILLNSKYQKVVNTYYTICKTEERILNLSVNSNLANIYQAITNLSEEVDHTVCPVCKTPLSKTVINPFENAIEELKNLEEYNTLSDKLREEEKLLIQYIKDYNNFVKTNTKVLESIDITTVDMLFLNLNDSEDIHKQTNKNIIEEQIKKIYSINGNPNIPSKTLQNYNNEAKRYNENNPYIKELNDLRALYKELLELKGSFLTINNDIAKLKKTISQFNSELIDLQNNVNKEKEINNKKKHFLSAYNQILKSLTKYQKELPSLISRKLSSKVLEYYNLMNQNDVQFEIIKDLAMPVSSSDYIKVVLNDDIEADALQILSEGHIKLLGLAILLAKAKETNQHFIILDDIVNAIDDDHRSGVANLLYNNPDFKNTQIILTCHSEAFIKRIEDCIPRNERNNRITRYVFLTPSKEEVRGIVVDYSNPKEPLELASKDIKNNEYKDAAQKCRQAAESLINRLWKKLANTYKIQISVALSAPNALPDFASVTDGIIKVMKQFENEDGSVLSDLNKIKSDFQWFLLNKGTHFEDDQFQFEKTEVISLFELLSKLEKDISELKIKSLIMIEDN